MHREQADAGQFCSRIDGNMPATTPSRRRPCWKIHGSQTCRRDRASTADFDTKTFRISLTQAQDIESILNGLCDILPITVKRDENGHYVYSRP
ncbi:MAG: hypothetical protein ACLTZY_03075 [Alistipes indistinctus]